MHNSSYNNRTLKINKKQLIEILKKHKAAHVEEYADAVKAYREEAARQLKDLRSDLKNGALNLKLDLVTPINRESDYDKLVLMFEWEIDEEIIVDQSEFNMYVHNEMPFAISANLSNSMYLSAPDLSSKRKRHK